MSIEPETPSTPVPEVEVTPTADLKSVILAAFAENTKAPTGRKPSGPLVDTILRAAIAVALAGGGYYAEKVSTTVDALVVLPGKVDTLTNNMRSLNEQLERLEIQLQANTVAMKEVRAYTVPGPPPEPEDGQGG